MPSVLNRLDMHAESSNNCTTLRKTQFQLILINLFSFFFFLHFAFEVSVNPQSVDFNLIYFNIIKSTHLDLDSYYVKYRTKKHEHEKRIYNVLEPVSVFFCKSLLPVFTVT